MPTIHKHYDIFAVELGRNARREFEAEIFFTVSPGSPQTWHYPGHEAAPEILEVRVKDDKGEYWQGLSDVIEMLIDPDDLLVTAAEYDPE